LLSKSVLGYREIVCLNDMKQYGIRWANFNLQINARVLRSPIGVNGKWSLLIEKIPFYVTLKLTDFCE
jgi:hypothetical protein